MQGIFERSELLLSRAGMQALAEATVAVFGIGGVGGAAAEALARCGVGNIVIVDADFVSASNINRQIVATGETVGRAKVDVMRERIKSINPACNVTALREFVLAENVSQFVTKELSYIIDAVDTVAAKLAIAERAAALSVPQISCMGAGNKLDPTRFRVSDIKKTSVCPLCRVMRRELKAREIPALLVVWSDEPPIEHFESERGGACLSGYCDLKPPKPVTEKRQTTGSVSFVPPVAGMIAAGEAIKHIAGANRL